MLFWIFVIVLFVSVGLIIIGTRKWSRDKHKFLYYHDEGITCTGVVATVISAVVIFGMLCGICTTHIPANADLAKYQETHKALTYKLESGACRDELGLLSKSVIDEIQDWNESVVRKKNFQKDFWIGIFYPNIYDEFETIDYTKYSKE